MATIAVDLRTLNPEQNNSARWEGIVPVFIEKAVMKATKNDANQGYLELQIKALDGKYKGQIHVDRFNIFNNSQQTVEIAMRKLAAIGRCTGLVTDTSSPTEYEQFQGGTFIGVFGLQDSSDKYTELKKAYYPNGDEPTMSGPKPTSILEDFKAQGTETATASTGGFTGATPATASVGTSGNVPWGNKSPEPAQTQPASGNAAPWGSNNAAATPTTTNAAPWNK